jgi:hypothetical protein
MLMYGFVLGACGYGVIAIYGGWKLAGGIFLVHWAVNIERKFA